jgi:hypothetical protein
MINLGPKRVEEPARGFIKPMDESVVEYLQVSGLLQRKKAAPAIAAWDEAAGPELSERARAVSFRRGILTIEVESSTLLSELRGFASEDLRARADALLEEASIRKLSFKLKRR